MNYQSFLAKSKIRHGNLFDPSDLAIKFIPYFENGQRIKVKTPYEGIKFGTVGVTCGWKPVFLLMHDSRAIGSSQTLDARYEILSAKGSNGRS